MAALTALGPDKRMMATPPAWGTTGVAMATMVSPSPWDEKASSSSWSSEVRVAGAAEA
jgi:hypothetical protein